MAEQKLHIGKLNIRVGILLGAPGLADPAARGARRAGRFAIGAQLTPLTHFHPVPSAGNRHAYRRDPLLGRIGGMPNGQSEDLGFQLVKGASA
jgi:hypothetical protein